MPVVSSIVAEDGGLQADGTKFIRFAYTLSTGEVLTHYGYRKYPGNTDAETQRAALIPDVNAMLIEREKKFAWSYGAGGGNIDTYPWAENTLADIQQYWWRRFMNLYNTEGNASLDEQTTVAVEAAAYYNLPTNNEISGFIDDPAYTTQVVNGIMSDVAAIAVNIGNIEHSEPELPL